MVEATVYCERFPAFENQLIFESGFSISNHFSGKQPCGQATIHVIGGFAKRLSSFRVSGPAYLGPRMLTIVRVTVLFLVQGEKLTGKARVAGVDWPNTPGQLEGYHFQSLLTDSILRWRYSHSGYLFDKDVFCAYRATSLLTFGGHMRAHAFVQFAVLVLLASAISQSAYAQMTAPPPPQLPSRDGQAVAALQRSLAALGGGAATSAADDAVLRGQFQPIAGSTQTPGTFVWKYRWAQGTNDFAEETRRGSDDSYFVSGNGTPRALHHSRVWPVSDAALVRPSVYFPSRAILSELITPTYEVGPIVEATLEDGRPAIRIHVELSTSDPELREASFHDWFLDPSTWLPVRLDYRQCVAPDPDWKRERFTTVPTSIDYSDFRVVDSVRLPFKLSISLMGKPIEIADIASASLNSGLTSADFDAPDTGDAR